MKRIALTLLLLPSGLILPVEQADIIENQENTIDTIRPENDNSNRNVRKNKGNKTRESGNTLTTSGKEGDKTETGNRTASENTNGTAGTKDGNDHGRTGTASAGTLRRTIVIFYGFDSDYVGAEERRKLVGLVIPRGARVVVSSTSDSTGTYRYNDNIAWRRAINVIKLLKKRFPAAVYFPRALGERKQYTGNRSRHDRFLNRRSTIQIFW